MNPLISLLEHGQSLWLDYIRRDLMTGGKLQAMVEDDGLRGLTSNPSIFEAAINGSFDYDASIREITRRNPDITAERLYERLAVEDIQMAADILRPVFLESSGDDGYVSLEVSPHLAYDTATTISEAERFWKLVNRKNLLIKVPATRQGVAAVEKLIADGVNVNATLMFSMDHYEGIAMAYVNGLKRNATPSALASVASFFVSRVDTAVDAALEKIGTPEALALRGKVALANSHRVYRRFQEVFHGETFAELKSSGARVQRPLWGSTSTKNPAYSDILYVEDLVAPETVNTLPMATIDAFRDHGEVKRTIMDQFQTAKEVFDSLERLGVDMDAITEKLQADGVKAFADSYDKLLSALNAKMKVVAVK
jgi:transaldolase